MTGKMINVARGYQIRFDQRAKGQETPYWVGTIFLNGKAIGFFNNSGTGGATIISPWHLSKEFEAIFDQEASKFGMTEEQLNAEFEREEHVFRFADLVAHKRDCKDLTFSEYCEILCKQEV